MSNRILIILGIATILLVVAALSHNVSSVETKSFENTAINVRDALGRSIILKNVPKRIISLAPSITETLFYLGLQDHVIALDNESYSDPYFGIKEYVRSHDIVAVGGYWWSTIDVEKIISLKPDLVLADAGAHQPLLQYFEDYNISVIFLHAGSSRSIQDIYDDLEIVSTAFNISQHKITKFINYLEGNITFYRHLLGENIINRKILVVVGIYNGIWVAGKSTYIDDVLSRLGLINAAEIIGWKPVSIEQIHKWSPDIIIVSSMGISEKDLREAGLYDVGASVIILNKTETDIISRPGPLVLKLPKTLYDVLKDYVGTTTATPENPSIMGLSYQAIIAVIVSFIIGLAVGYLVYRKV